MTPLYKKTCLAIAALCFYAPLVQYYLPKKLYKLSNEDEQFVRGYIKRGYRILSAIFLCIILYVYYMFSGFSILGIITDYLIYGVTGVICLSIIMILLGKPIFHRHDSKQKVHGLGKKVVGDTEFYIKSYLPGNNLVMRYTRKHFDKPSWRIKESLLLWTFFVGEVMIRNNQRANTIILLSIIVRVMTLMSEVDVLPMRHKQRLHRLFHTNIEEIRGYISGSIRFIYHKSIAKSKDITRGSCIDTEKAVYQHLYNIEEIVKNSSQLSGSLGSKIRAFFHQSKYMFIFEYSVVCISLIFISYQTFYYSRVISRDIGTLYPYLALAIIIFRYIFALHSGKIGHIPLIYDLIRLIQKVLPISQ